jgi:hypothetical protein
MELAKLSGLRQNYVGPVDERCGSQPVKLGSSIYQETRQLDGPLLQRLAFHRVSDIGSVLISGECCSRQRPSSVRRRPLTSPKQCATWCAKAVDHPPRCD